MCGDRMTPLERAGFLAHARTAAFQRRVAEAEGAIAGWIAATERRAVSYSAGKDSEVLLHLIRRQDPDCIAVFSDDEWNLPETLERVAATPNLIRIAARIWHAEWFTAWASDSEGLPADTHWVEAERNNGLATWARRQDYDGEAIGIRAQESWARRRNIRKFGLVHRLVGTGIWRCSALGWWRVEDIWAYLLTQDVPYNRAYDRLSAIGVPRRQQRIGPFAVERVISLGQLGILRQGWPDLFEEFARRYPEARRYA